MEIRDSVTKPESILHAKSCLFVMPMSIGVQNRSGLRIKDITIITRYENGQQYLVYTDELNHFIQFQTPPPPDDILDML